MPSHIHAALTGSVRFNLDLAGSGVEDDKLWAALRMVQLAGELSEAGVCRLACMLTLGTLGFKHSRVQAL